MPRFSVVIPAYNAEHTVGDTIRSILAQTEPDFELIVVDDGSQDRTPELVEGFAADPRVTLVSQPNQGTAAARNTGIAHASAAYVSFLDNDDLWMPYYLEEMGAALDANPDAGFAFCDGWALQDASSRVHWVTEMHYRPPPPPGADQEEVFLALADRNFVLSSTTVRRDALEAAGRFDSGIRGVDDYDMWFRIMLTGRTAVQASERPLMLWRDRTDSQSKDELMMYQSLRDVLALVAADPRAPSAVREQLEERIRGVDRELTMMSGRNRLPRIAYWLRGSALAMRESLFRNRYWPAQPPPEVAAAFPHLGRR